MATKASRRNPSTYEPAENTDEPTSYDTSRPGTDTPQEIREGAESSAMMDREQEARKGTNQEPGADGVATSS
jgi:hypothetical protein